MNAQTNELSRPAQGERLCAFCSQPWFGPVAYCPYCGKPSVGSPHRQPNDRPHPEKAVASGQEDVGMPAGEFQWREGESSHKESRRKPISGLPIFDKDPPTAPAGPAEPTEPTGRSAATPSRMNRTAVALLFTAAAGAGALLSWMVLKLPAPKTDAGASVQLPAPGPGMASPRPGPSTGAAQVPSIPARTAPAVPPQVPSIPARTDAPVPPPPNRGSLCSAASEAAGLCKSQ